LGGRISRRSKKKLPAFGLIGLSGVTIVSLLTAVFVFDVAAAPAQRAAASTQFTAFTRTIQRGATVSTSGHAPAVGVTVADPEIADEPRDEGGDSANAQARASATGKGFGGVDRSFTRQHGKAGHGAEATHASRAMSHPEVATSFDGLNHRQQRLANGGNQFSVEPPDQGLCANGSFELESLNDVLQVYDPHGVPQLNGGNAVDLNTFYGYPAAINRTTGVFGQFVTDPSCYFDQDTNRWFNVVLTLEVDPASGDFTGDNHLDLAVSLTSDPRGSWVNYRLPVQDNGTDGTPDHGCSFGFCLGDYPHIGADKYGFYITTNEYSFFGPEFHGAQVYAISKAALASASPSVTVVQFDTHSAHPGFTIWPATSPASQYATGNRGTEYFLSSTAADEVQCPDFSCTGTGSSDNILQWTLTNTRSLNSSPALTLSNASIHVQQYSVPPKATQKAGPTPLRDCLNDTTCATFLNGAPDPFAPEVEYALDSNDTRMQQVTFADGKLWGALDTAVTVNGTPVAGVAFYRREARKPLLSSGG
jgi:hypothetical protein